MKSSKFGYLNIGSVFGIVAQVVKRREMGLADVMSTW